MLKAKAFQIRPWCRSPDLKRNSKGEVKMPTKILEFFKEIMNFPINFNQFFSVSILGKEKGLSKNFWRIESLGKFDLGQLYVLHVSSNLPKQSIWAIGFFM